MKGKLSTVKQFYFCVFLIVVGYLLSRQNSINQYRSKSMKIRTSERIRWKL